MPDPLNLFFSIFFGVLGGGYFMYGKKNSLYFMLAGIALMSYTFLVETTSMVIWCGVALAIIPFILNKFFE